MLFHVTARHNPENCPDAFPDKKRSGVGTADAVRATGVRVIAAYHDGPGHTTYFIVETDSAEKLSNFLMPAAAIGICEIRPVTDMLAKAVKV